MKENVLTPETRVSPSKPWGSLGILAICVGVIAAGLAVEVSSDQAHWHGAEGPRCLVRGIFGDEACPGCGLTRATALVLQGRWREAWEIHGGGFVIALLCCAGIPLHLDILRRGEVRSVHRHLGRIGRWALLVGVVAPWLWRTVISG